MTELTDFKRIIYEPEVAALNARARAAESRLQQAQREAGELRLQVSALEAKSSAWFGTEAAARLRTAETALRKAVDTFDDFAVTSQALGRVALAEAARIASRATSAALEAVSA